MNVVRIGLPPAPVVLLPLEPPAELVELPPDPEVELPEPDPFPVEIAVEVVV